MANPKGDLFALRQLGEKWESLGKLVERASNKARISQADEDQYRGLISDLQELYGRLERYVGNPQIYQAGRTLSCFQDILSQPFLSSWFEYDGLLPLLVRAWAAASSSIKQAIGKLAREPSSPFADGHSPTSLGSMHADIVKRSSAAFELGSFDDAIFNAMKTVEERLRQLSAAEPDDIGVALVSKALNPRSPRVKLSEVSAEQEAFHSLYRGAIGALKNPHSHRFVDTTDPVKTLEILGFASLLMRILDEAARDAGR